MIFEISVFILVNRVVALLVYFTLVSRSFSIELFLSEVVSEQEINTVINIKKSNFLCIIFGNKTKIIKKAKNRLMFNILNSN